MKSVNYINVIWFLIVLSLFGYAEIYRHQSEFWDGQKSLRLAYDILYVGLIGVYFIFAIFGLLKEKKWGYENAIGANIIIVFIALLPVIGFSQAVFTNDISFAEAVKYNWGVSPLSAGIVLISCCLIALLLSKNVKKYYKVT